MAEPGTSHSSDALSPPQHATPDAARPAADRELPVSAIDDDGGTRHRLQGDAEAPPPSSADVPSVPAADGDSTLAEGALTEDQVKLALRRVKDPELNLNILDLGLVYEIRVSGSAVAIDMSLTSPGCPSGPEIMSDAERHLRAIPGVTDVAVNLVWSPFWSPDRIEPRVRAYLGF